MLFVLVDSKTRRLKKNSQASSTGTRLAMSQTKFGDVWNSSRPKVTLADGSARTTTDYNSIVLASLAIVGVV